MELINENIPSLNEYIGLIYDESILKSKYSTVNSEDNYQEEKNQQSITLNEQKFLFNTIRKTINISEVFQVIKTQLNIRKDTTFLFVVNNNEYENILSNIKNLLSTENKTAFKINNVNYNYSDLNEDKIINISKNKDINTDEIINNLKNSVNENMILSLLEFNIHYSDINIISKIKMIFIFKSYEKIFPYFSLNKNEYEQLFLTEKIKQLLLAEKSLKDKINKIPEVNEDYLKNIEIYKKEVIGEYSKFVNNIKKLDKNKDNNEIYNELQSFINTINNLQFQQKEKDIYKKYIEIYNQNKIFSCNKNKIKKNNTFPGSLNNEINKQSTKNNLNYNKLKQLIIKFNNLNEELINYFEKTNDEEIIKLNKTVAELEKDISNKNNKIKELEKDISNKNSKIKELTKGISSKNSKIKELEKEISNKNTKIQEAEKEILTKDTKIKELEKDISTKDTKIKELEKQISIKNNKIKELTKTLENSNQSPVNTVISQTENKSFYKRIDSLKKSEERRSSYVKEIQNLKDTIKALKHEISKSRTKKNVLTKHKMRLNSIQILNNSNKEVQNSKYLKENVKLKNEINELNGKIQTLVNENNSLKSQDFTPSVKSPKNRTTNLPKNKTSNTVFTNNSNSNNYLLHVKKIEKENKEEANQLKNCLSQNALLEMSIKQITKNDYLRNINSYSSTLNFFTLKSKSDLKGI